MSNIFWDILQQHQIQEARREAENASKDVRDAKREFRTVPDKFARLALATQAVWELVKEKYDLDDTDLLNKMEEIDIRDGVRDGKASATTMTCLGCGKKIRTSHKECLFCGTPNNMYSPFTKVTD